MPVEQFRIRPATLDDVPAVLALDRVTELLPHWSGQDYTSAVEDGSAPGPSQSVRRRLCVAEDDAAMVGFFVASIASFGDEVCAELESVAVATGARRSGAGLALCREAIAWARLQGATVLRLEVRSRSQPAIALYERLGFIRRGRRPAYYASPADDAMLMQLDLA